eukprot:8720254-Alexandrium_andersonii.AAC.1
MGGPSGERSPASRQMAPRPSRATAVASPAAMGLLTLARASSGRAPRRSASQYRGHFGAYWRVENRRPPLLSAG